MLFQGTWWGVRTRDRWLTSRSRWARPALRAWWWRWTGKTRRRTQSINTLTIGAPPNVFYLHRIFTGSTRLDGNAIGERVSFTLMMMMMMISEDVPHRVSWSYSVHSGLCAVVVCRLHGRAGLSAPGQDVQPAEDRGDLLLQHEPHPAAVVPYLAGHRRPLQQGGWNHSETSFPR